MHRARHSSRCACRAPLPLLVLRRAIAFWGDSSRGSGHSSELFDVRASLTWPVRHLLHVVLLLRLLRGYSLLTGNMGHAQMLPLVPGSA